MRTRKPGTTDLELTTIGLGTWAIGGPWEYGWGPQDDVDSIATIVAGLEEGVNWIDTAPAYGCGHSEIVVGRAIKEFGQKPIIATKCGIVCDQQRRKQVCLDAPSVIHECETSLRSLGVEAIDLYQMHWPDPEEKIEEAWQAMVTLRDQGKVRYIGVSNFNISQLERISQIEPPASLQPPYSMLERGIESEILPYCVQHDIGVVAYSPMHCGLLTGKYTSQKIAALPEDDHRRRTPDFMEPRLTANLQFVDSLRPIADRCGITCAHLALAWATRSPQITAAIAGARHPRQIKETVKASEIQLDANTLAEIEVLLEERARRVI